MKKYKLLKDLPTYSSGHVFTTSSTKTIELNMAILDPYCFSDWFEEIKEPSDEEVIYKWIMNGIGHLYQETAETQMRVLAKALIVKGFKAEWVKECEHEWIDIHSIRNHSKDGEICVKCMVRK